MTVAFDADPYPDEPRILFIGLAQSSHTHAWIDLLSESELNVRLFAIPNSVPPTQWPIKTYVSLSSIQNNTSTREYLYSGTAGKARNFYNGFAVKHYLKQIGTSEEWLFHIIKSWQPHIIHTLGLEPASYYYFDVRKKFHLASIGKWIVQVRGGPDLALNRFLPEYAQKIRSVFQECDQVIADNQQNYEYALEMGLDGDRICELGTLPGSGGIDVEGLKNLWQDPPSTREKIIVWPKAYECPQSKALPVFEALKLAWHRLPPCKLFMFAADHETMLWFQALPEYIKEASSISYRVPRNELLSCLVKARVMLAPSILDGIPNSLYEAMASGAFPIVSPLETISQVVRENENVLFARNLYPAEVAEALVKAMSDDALIDRASRNNYLLVSQIANRALIIPKITDYYCWLSQLKAQ
jgi:glycosyltransferase involved in cell wall biosynthesis